MAAKVPLPQPDTLPATVVFHRESPVDEMIVLQVPNADRTEAETYVLRTTNVDDMLWIERLKHGKELKTLLTMEQHVAFDPGTGHMQPIRDLDAPSDLQFAIGMARHDIDNPPFQRAFDPNRIGGFGRAPSPFRQWLIGKPRDYTPGRMLR